MCSVLFQLQLLILNWFLLPFLISLTIYAKLCFHRLSVSYSFLFTFSHCIDYLYQMSKLFLLLFSINFLYQNVFSLLFSSTICISAVAPASRGGWNPLLNWLIYIPTNVKVLRALSAHAFIMAA